MKYSLEPNVFCDGQGCDRLITTTAEDAPTADAMITEIRHFGWRVILDAAPDPETAQVLTCYCPECAKRLSFAAPFTALEKARLFIAGFEGDDAQEGIGELLAVIDSGLAMGDTPPARIPGHCAYCQTKMVAEIVSNTGGNLHYARCPECSAHGPWAKSKAEALSK